MPKPTNKHRVRTMMRLPVKTASSWDNDEVSDENHGIFIAEICRRDDVFPAGNFANDNFDSGHALLVSTSNHATKTFLYPLFFLFSVVGFMTAVSYQAKMCAICWVYNHIYPRSSSPWVIDFGFAFDESRASLSRSPTYGTHFRLARHGRHHSDLKNNICVRRENSYCVIPELDDPRRWNPRTSVASGQWLLGRPRVHPSKPIFRWLRQQHRTRWTWLHHPERYC